MALFKRSVSLFIRFTRSSFSVLQFRCFKNVTDPANSMYQFLAKIAVDFISYPADQDINNVCLRVEIVFPYMFHNHCLGDDGVDVSYQIFEKREFKRCEFDFFARAGNLPPEKIHRDIMNRYAGGFGDPAGPSDKGLNTGQQLGKGKGLSEVIVAPCMETFYAVINATAGT